MSWTHISDPLEAARLFPTWLGRRLVGIQGRFGLLLVTGDVMRVTSIMALHHSSDGLVLMDVSLDSAGVPDGVDLAWRPKHYLGLPVAGAAIATVNLAQVVAVVEFAAADMSDRPRNEATPTVDEVIANLDRMTDQVEEVELSSDASSRPLRVGGASSSIDGAAQTTRGSSEEQIHAE